MNKKTYCYIRTNESFDVVSAYDQYADIMLYAKRQNIVITDFAKDNGSGLMLNINLCDILEESRKGLVDCVIVHRLNRLSRNQKKIQHVMNIFNKYKVRLISVQENLDTNSSRDKFMIILGSLMNKTSQNKCQCDSNVLFHVGCQCGGS